MTLRLEYRLSILFCIALFSTIFAQSPDYYKIYKNTSNHDTIRFNALYEYIWEEIYSNTDTAESLAINILKNEKLNEYPAYKSKFYNAAGAVNQLKGNYVKSINFYQEGLKIDERINDLRSQAIKLGNIGSIYLNLGNHEMALKFLKKCLLVLNKKDDENNRASVYNNLSIIYEHEGNLSHAMSYCNKAIAIYEKLGDYNSLVYCYNNLGNLYQAKKEYENAISYFEKALALANQTENSVEIAKTYSELGTLYFEIGKDQLAIKYLKLGEKIAEENQDYLSLLDLERVLSNYYYKHKQYKEAIDHHKSFLFIKDTLEQESKQREINKVILEHEYQKKAEQDSTLMANERALNEEKLKLKNAEIEKANNQKIFFIAFIVFLLLVSVVIFNRFRLTRRQKLIIEEKNKQTEEQKLIIEEKQKEIVDSINYAKRIQDSLLDNIESAKRFFTNSFILLKPKDIVSGDFYWISKRIMDKVHSKGESSVVTETFFIAVCDSTGHGVPGGFMSLLNMAYLSEAINEKNIFEPSKIFDYVRDRLIHTVSKNDQKDGFDGVLLRFDKHLHFKGKELIDTTYELTYSGAYNAPIIIRDNQLDELACDKMPVGIGARNEAFKSFSQDLKEGDTIYVYTDGYADQFGGPKGKKYKYRQLNEFLLSIHKKDFNLQEQLLNDEFTSWKGELEQIDDVCILGIRI
ncbi:MAG: tetratricopeptide repeat protein [Bacteroidia bacterium]